MLALVLAAGGAHAQQAMSAAGGEATGPLGSVAGHVVLPCTNGQLTSWGENYYGQLGNGSYGGSFSSPAAVVWPNQPAVIKTAVSVQASFAIDAAGNLWAWGDNSTGKLGLGSGVSATAVPMQVAGISNVVAVSGGNAHTIALRADGTVWSWGTRAGSALGTGASGPAVVHTPQQIALPTSIRAVASGDLFSLALDVNGHLWSWGVENAGELGLNTAPGNHFQATPAQVPLPNVAFKHMDAAYNRAAAVSSNGQLYSWGQNANYELGLGHPNYTALPTLIPSLAGISFASVAVNLTTTMAVQPLGGTYVWGSNSHGQFGRSTAT